MESDEIVRLIRAVPFEPFELHLSDNRSFVVDHPEFVSLSHTNRV